MDQPVTAATDRSPAEDASAHRQAIELLFFAYRDFTHDADEMLARYGFGRAHHRVIYFVGRHPGIRVGELLAILKISKQALAPVLSQLIAEGFVVQRRDVADGRRRCLHLSAEAAALERSLTARQGERVAAAVAEAGPDAAVGFARVLRALVNPEDRHRVAEPGNTTGARP
jgi:DNA-binding MarR family transcriptional regulator